MTTIEHDAWTALVHSQHGVVTRAQLVELGVDDHAIAHRLHQRRWQRVLHRVYSVHTGPLTRPALLEAAVLYGGAEAALSHRTAAEEWGMLRLVADARVHVTVPYGRSITHQPPAWGLSGLAHPGVVVHRSRAFAHIVVVADPPRTSSADTALDLAVAETTARDAGRTLVAMTGAGRIPVGVLRERIERRRPPRHGSILRDTLRLMTGGAQSALEHRYAMDVEAAHDLPEARRQSPVVVDGHTLYEDVDYSATGVPLIVRLDGRRYHSLPPVAFRDRRRDNAAELAGRPRLVYGWDEVAQDPCGVAGEVATVLHRGGWSGAAHRCARCP